MKAHKILKFIFTSVFLTLILLLTSCASENQDSIKIVTKDGKEYRCDYTVVFGEGGREYAEDIAELINEKYGIAIECKSDGEAEDTALEILVLAESRADYRELESRAVKSHSEKSYYTWGYSISGERLVLYFSHDTYAKDKLCELLRPLMKKNGFSLYKTSEVIKHKSIYLQDAEETLGDKLTSLGDTYTRFYTALERNNELLSPADGAYLSAFGGSITERLTEYSGITYQVPDISPNIGEHPRVNVNKSSLNRIKAMFSNAEFSAERAELMLLADNDFDGCFSVSRNDEEVIKLLSVIEAKAFVYLLTDKIAYGYEAIASVKYALLTLAQESKYAPHLLTVCAEVYDWCYPLLTKRDKEQIVAGAEKYMRAAADDDIGFPPSKLIASSLDCEADKMLYGYLAFSAAIYDEYPDWWEFCGGRFYSEFTEPIEIYMKSAMLPAASAKGAADSLYTYLEISALITSLGGNTPYEGLDKVIHSLLGHLLPDGRLFSIGSQWEEASAEIYYKCAIMSASLFDDAQALYYGKLYSDGYEKFEYSSSTWTPINAFIYLSYAPDLDECAPALPLLQYNGLPLGQIIARNSQGESTAAVLMKINQIATDVQRGCNSGTFQIYYKGLLSGVCGFEVGDGNQGRFGAEAENHYYFYKYNTDGSVKYAYLAAEYALAQDCEALEYAERRMLTVYTDNPDFPMLLIAFDRVISKNADTEKKFTVNTSSEPLLIDNDGDGEAELALISEGAGALVINPVAGAQKIEKFCDTKNTSVINEHIPSVGDRLNNLSDMPSASGITLTSVGEQEANMLSLLYVKDTESNQYLAPRLIENEMLTGVQIDNEIAVFVNDSSQNAQILEFEVREYTNPDLDTSDKINCLISGVKSGIWTVLVDGVKYGTAICPQGKDVISFSAPAGKITLVPSFI